MGSTMSSTMAVLGTETSLPVENDAVGAESIDSNGEAEEDVLHKVFGQHLEVSPPRPRHDRRFIQCYLISRTILPR